MIQIRNVNSSKAIKNIMLTTMNIRIYWTVSAEEFLTQCCINENHEAELCK